MKFYKIKFLVTKDNDEISIRQWSSPAASKKAFKTKFKWHITKIWSIIYKNVEWNWSSIKKAQQGYSYVSMLTQEECFNVETPMSAFDSTLNTLKAAEFYGRIKKESWEEQEQRNLDSMSPGINLANPFNYDDEEHFSGRIEKATFCNKKNYRRKQ